MISLLKNKQIDRLMDIHIPSLLHNQFARPGFFLTLRNSVYIKKKLDSDKMFKDKSAMKGRKDASPSNDCN